MSAVEEIRLKLRHRLILIEQEIDSLRTALTALDEQEAATPAAAPEPAAASATAPARRIAPARRARDRAATAQGAPASPTSAELERRLTETGGLTAVELARQTGTDYAVVLERIRQLEAAGQRR